MVVLPDIERAEDGFKGGSINESKSVFYDGMLLRNCGNRYMGFAGLNKKR